MAIVFRTQLGSHADHRPHIELATHVEEKRKFVDLQKSKIAPPQQRTYLQPTRFRRVPSQKLSRLLMSLTPSRTGTSNTEHVQYDHQYGSKLNLIYINPSGVCEFMTYLLQNNHSVCSQLPCQEDALHVDLILYSADARLSLQVSA
jgi:hypothetical protein